VLDSSRDKSIVKLAFFKETLKRLHKCEFFWSFYWYHDEFTVHTHKKIVPCFIYQFFSTISLWATCTVHRYNAVCFDRAALYSDRRAMRCFRVGHKMDVCLNCAAWHKYLLITYAPGIRAVGFILQPVSQFIFLFPVRKIQSLLQYDGFAVFPLCCKCLPLSVGCFLLLIRMIQVSLFLIRSLGLSYVFLINDYRCLFIVSCSLVCIDFMVLPASVFVSSVGGHGPRHVRV
jgi:hypothetical protein